MKHLDRDTLLRFYDSDLEDEGVEHVLQHLTSCEQCEELAEQIWSKIEPKTPGSVDRGQTAPISRRRRERVREAALSQLRFGQLLKDFLDFFTHGLGQLLRVVLAPLEHALDDSSDSKDRRKKP